MGEDAHKKAGELVNALRKAGLIAEYDVVGRGLKAQMKYANKIGARFSTVLGDEEIANGTARLKNMSTGEQSEIPTEKERFVKEFTAVKLADDFKDR